MRGPIVVGVDGSDTSQLGLDEASSIAQRVGLKVVAIFVRFHRFRGSIGAFTPNAATHLEDNLDSMQFHAYAQTVAALDPLGVSWRFEVRTGAPATELMLAAKSHHADTIVVAGRRHNTLGGLASASVSAQLLHRWPHTLMVVHPPPAESMWAMPDSLTIP